jgi:hypothetical protein
MPVYNDWREKCGAVGVHFPDLPEATAIKNQPNFMLLSRI